GMSRAGLLSNGLSLLGCLLFVAIYPQIVALTRRLFDATVRLPWLLYPVPLGLFICVVIFASPSGVPGFIYASF
ncbi:MBOAT family protein, partial [Pseudomonas sp. FW306-02-F02-AB]